MRQVAFAYLTKYRPTSGKLRQYLLRKNYQLVEINTLINELCELKYLDDYAAAERILHLCRHSGAYGKIGLQALLLRKGVEYNCAQVLYGISFKMSMSILCWKIIYHLLQVTYCGQLKVTLVIMLLSRKFYEFYLEERQRMDSVSLH